MISKQEEKRILKKQEKIEKGMKGVEEEIKNLKLSQKRKAAKIIKRIKLIRFPKTINILESTWTIILKEELIFEEKEVNGLCSYRNREITLCLANEDIVQTFLHEVQHAIDYSFGNVFEELRKIKGNKIFNEFRVSILAKIWLGIFKQLKKNSEGIEK